jgi:hypothetical protein
MFWLEEELAGPPPQVEGGGGQLWQLAHIAQARPAHLHHIQLVFPIRDLDSIRSVDTHRDPDPGRQKMTHKNRKKN